MALRLSDIQLEAIRRHGGRDYPNECCGMLLGQAEGTRKEVWEVIPLRNLRRDAEKARAILPLAEPATESERNRFLIDPQDQLRVEKEARARGLEVVGYYHSHPDHSALPSKYDREHAWPWYSYMILSVVEGEPKDLTCWVLTDDRQRFDPEQVEVRNS